MNNQDLIISQIRQRLEILYQMVDELESGGGSGDSYTKAQTDALLAQKQDTLAFNGTYSASTNKAATVSTITNAINDLDVAGDSDISASKTIKSWSEADGKINISTQDIAVASSQVTTMTNYSKAQSGSAIATTDTLNEAIGKLEYKADTDTAALVELIDGGAKNHLTQTDFSGTTSVDIPIYLKAGTYVIYYDNLTSSETYYNSLCRLYDDTSGTNVQRASTVLTKGNNKNVVITVSGDTTFMRVYAADNAAHSSGQTVAGTNFMVCTKAAWDISQTFQPYRPSYQELYEMVQALQA